MQKHNHVCSWPLPGPAGTAYPHLQWAILALRSLYHLPNLSVGVTLHPPPLTSPSLRPYLRVQAAALPALSSPSLPSRRRPLPPPALSPCPRMHFLHSLSPPGSKHFRPPVCNGRARRVESQRSSLLRDLY